MISRLRGKAVAWDAEGLVLDVNGVGYRLAVSAETLRSVPARGRETTLHAHLVAREDSLSLYGFASEEERDLFLQLISVNGVGPKVAIAALSGGAARELVRAIAAGDAKRFQAVPGIGKRTAERIIVELREKVSADLDEATLAGAVEDAEPRALAREGLVSLGYSPAEAEKLLDRAQGDSAEEMIGAGLRGAAGAGASAKAA